MELKFTLFTDHKPFVLYVFCVVGSENKTAAIWTLFEWEMQFK